MTTSISADSLHRLVKQAMDSGAASSAEEAHALYQGYQLRIVIDTSAARDPVQQAVLLTTVALAVRVFLGGVRVAGVLDAPLLVPMLIGRTLAEAVTDLGGIVEQNDGSASGPRIIVGGPSRERSEGFSVRTVVRGWRGGIIPADSELEPSGKEPMPLAGMLAAALAVNEAFLHVNSSAPAAGRRVVGLSLWRPACDTDWLLDDDSEPRLTYLPSRLWLIGLGHLGQAYLWGLGLLPYADPRSVSLLLQDTDHITVSSQSTSILTHLSMVGQKKARVMAQWAEQRGFEVAICERLFAADFKRQPDEPAIALCGVDNATARRALDQVGFDLIVEAGLGRGHRDFRTLRLHVLPGPRAAADLWRPGADAEKVEDRPAYAQLLSDGLLDQCGMTLLAGKAVGAPFVGAVAGALVLSEVLRLLHGGPLHQVMDIDLLSLDQRLTVTHPGQFGHLNPGFSYARQR